MIDIMLLLWTTITIPCDYYGQQSRYHVIIMDNNQT